MIKTKKMNYLSLSTLLLVSACASTPGKLSERNPAGIEDCYHSIVSFFQKPRTPFSKKVTKNITESMAKNPLRFAKGFEDMPGQNIQYRVEIDYSRDLLDKLLLNFMPTPSIFRDSKEVWLSLTPERRRKWFFDYTNAIYPAYEGKKLEGLTKISDNPELREALPSSFNYDYRDKGGIRFKLELYPEDSMEEVIRKVENIQAHFGVGSMRVMISSPLNSDLLKRDKIYREELRQELLGYYNFMNEFDTLNMLRASYEKYLKDPTVESVPSFNDFWNGPMTKFRHDYLKGVIDGVVDQDKNLYTWLRTDPEEFYSQKYIRGLTFRPDLAYKKGRIATEVHGCLKDLKCIEDGMIRETYSLMKGKENFHIFSKIDPFDLKVSFGLLPYDVQKMLAKLFPGPRHQPVLEEEFFRNFSYPLRDWREHFYALETPGLKESVTKARVAYVKSLEDIDSDLKMAKITPVEARAKIMGLLGEFTKNSGLVEAMKSQFDKLVDPSELKHFDHLKFTRD